MASHPLPARIVSLSLGLSLLALTHCNRAQPPVPQAAASPSPTVAPRPAAAEQVELRPCCEQCVRASSRDPAGMDLSVLPCSRYLGDFRGAPGVDARCTTALAQSQSTVGSCQALLGPK